MIVRELRAGAESWERLAEETREELRAWLYEHGVDPADAAAVRLLNEGVIEVEEFVRDAQGRWQLDPNRHNHLHKRTRTVKVSYLPGQWP